nr:winged helix-turn-helix domain-containing protein [Butyricicoccus sp. OM06-6AC]
MADTGKLKRENTALLRQAMQNGSAGKNDLARLTHLSFPTVSRIVDEMVECGEAQEIGTAASTGGRCAMQYRLNPQYRLFLCLRLEQDTLHWFVCDLDGTPLEQEQQTCSGDVRELLDTLLMRVRARYPRLAAVVLGFAGTMHNGIVTESFGYPELRGVSLVRIFVIKPACRAWRLAICRSWPQATRRSTRPHRKPSCAFTSASWVQAQVSC